MSEGKRGFLSQAWGCIASPRKALESIQAGDLWKGAILILIMASASAWAGFIYASKRPIELPSFTGFGQAIDLEAFRRNVMTIFALRDGLGVVFGWLISSLLLHLFASLLGKGSLRRMLALTGFASIPLGFQQILRLLDAYTISKEAILSINAGQALSLTLAARLGGEALATFTVFGLWAFALTIVAASINYNAATKKAAVTVISAYLLLILLRLFLPL